MRGLPVYPLRAENLYCAHPRQCRRVDVLFIGSGIGLSCVRHLLQQAWRELGAPPRVAVADAGPLDLLTHMAHTGFPRQPFLREGGPHFGGLLPFWGVSAPRPREEALRRYPYDYEDLLRRFESAEVEMGVPDPIPKSGGHIEEQLLAALSRQFPACPVRVAPLAIDKDGRRWCPLTDIPDLVRQRVLLLPRFHCKHLITEGSRVIAVRGTWQDGRTYTLHSRFVALGVGVEASLPLVRQVCRQPLPLEAADHHRSDLHGTLPAGSFGPESVDDLGVGVLIMECAGKDYQVPYHLEIKVAPRALWARGYMQSADNLRGADSDKTIYVQVQAVAAMHDRFPATDLLNVAGAIPPVLSTRDASFHGEIVQMMRRVADALGLPEPTFSFRPLLTNHHLYGAYRVGKAVTREFRLQQLDNLYLLPPAAYVDVDDDANPTLKSRVLAQYALEDIVRNLVPTATPSNGRLWSYSI